jgi:hypothetical protein
MPEPNDLVQVLKQESTAKGGDDADQDGFNAWEQINENDDGLSAAGYYAQETQGTPARDKTCLIWREGGVWKGKDPTYGTVDLLASAAGGDDKKVKVSTNDTTPAFLIAKLLQGSGMIIALENPGANEVLRFTANVGTIFAADAINATIQLTTSLTSAQNAFAGETPDFLTPASDGDYLCFFATDIRTSNNNTEAEIALALNAPGSTIAGTEHRYTNTQRGFSSSAFRVNGLVTTDKIYANFRKVSGNGSVEIYNRNLFMFRVA